jgi:uncharacterized repeat protein (TIGR01451 family)
MWASARSAATTVVNATSNLVYTISVTNFGPSSAGSVMVTDTLPANVIFVSASWQRWCQQQRPSQLEFGHLDQRPGQQRNRDRHGAGLRLV